MGAPLYIITGAMAAGKSTIAKELVQRFAKSAYVSGDAFLRMIAWGGAVLGPALDAEARLQLHLRQATRLSALLKNETSKSRHPWGPISRPDSKMWKRLRSIALVPAISLTACFAAAQDDSQKILLDGVVPFKLEKQYQLAPFRYGGSMHEVVFSLNYRSGNPTTSSPVDTPSAIVVDLVRYLPNYLDTVFGQQTHMYSRYFETAGNRHQLEFRSADPNDPNGGELYVRRTGNHYDLIIECQFAAASPSSLCEMIYQLPNQVRVHARFSRSVVADWAAIERVTRRFVTARLR